MTKIDSLGVPLEPEDPPKIFIAWNGEWIYQGDEYYNIEGDRVPANDLEDYIVDTYGEAMIAE